MLTNSFKATVGGIVILIIAGGLTVTAYNQEQQIKDLQKQTAVVVMTPTQVPVIVTATPSATIAPIKKVIVPVKIVTPVITKAVVK